MNLQYDSVVQLYSRMDSTVLFTLVRLAYVALQRHFTASEVLILSSVTLTVCSLGSSQAKNMPSSILFEVLLTISSALFSQALVNGVTSNTVIFQSTWLFNKRVFPDFVAVTAVLLFVGSTPEQIQALSYINRATTLMLYMYTDAVGVLVHNIPIQSFVMALAVLLYVLLIRFDRELHSFKSMLYCIKAISMVCINTILTTVTSFKNSESDNAAQSVLVIIVLFITDSLCALTSKLEEGRSFAVWKSAQLLFVMYAQQNISQTMTVYLCVLVFVASVLNLLPNSTLTQLILLVTVNALLETITANLQQNSAYELFILFLWVLVMHLIPKFFARPDKSE